MDKRFFYVLAVVGVIIAIILAANDLKKPSAPSPVEKLNETPTPALYLKGDKDQAQTTNAPVPTATVKDLDTASPSAMKTLEWGIQVGDLLEGTGKEVKAGDTITVNYIGELQNGIKFDSSYDRGKPIDIQIGTGKVIRGWDFGILGMKVGGKRRLIIPPAAGYGAQGAGNLIPPNATLYFDVELLGIK